MDELEQQSREVLAGEPVTKDIFPFQVGKTATTSPLPTIAPDTLSGLQRARLPACDC